MNTPLKILLIATCAILINGCATIITLDHINNPDPKYGWDTCEAKRQENVPAVYSGTYTDIVKLILYPITDGIGGEVPLGIFYPIMLAVGVADLPFSFVADTIMLPWTIPIDTSCEEKARKAKEDRRRYENMRLPLDFTGTVVDSETGNPIDGAVVLAVGTDISQYSDVDPTIEAVSDKDGNVKIKGQFKRIYTPTIVVYKKGYIVQSNDRKIDANEIRAFKWQNGYIFKLEKPKAGINYINLDMSLYRLANDFDSEEKSLLLNTIKKDENNKSNTQLKQTEKPFNGVGIAVDPQAEDTRKPPPRKKTRRAPRVTDKPSSVDKLIEQ